jgi:hypothetical protein
MVSKYIIQVPVATLLLPYENRNIFILGLGKDLNKRLDIIGILLHVTVISLFCMSLLSVSIILLDCDPIYLLLKSLSLAPTPRTFSSFLLFIFRFALYTSLDFAIARSVSFVMIWAILILEILLHCIEMSRKRVSVMMNWNRPNSFKRFHEHLYLYQSLNLITFGYLRVFSPSFVIAIMSAGLGLEIASVFAIIRLQSLIEFAWPMYGTFVIMAVVVPLMADAELPKAIRIFENTEAILRKWKLKMTFAVRGDKRYYLKKIASLRPCSIYAGLGDVMFFPLRKSTKTTYYGLMIYYVTNALISVPESFTMSV